MPIGTTSNVQKYEFLDRNAQKGINYYRLRQVDFNGETELSKTVQIKHQAGVSDLVIAMVPNPCPDGQCSVNLSGVDSSQPVTIEVRDLTGRQVFSKQITGDLNTFLLPKLDAGKGIYILTAKNGKYTSHQKIILQ